MFRMGPLEIVIILVIVLIIFGATKMTQIGQSIGKKTSSTGEQGSETRVTRAGHPRLQIIGILIVVIGAVLMALSLGLIKAIAPYTIWAAVIIAIGVTTVIIARRR